MKRILFLPLAALAIAGCSDTATSPVENTSTPRYSSVHLKGGASAEPTFNDLGLALRASGALSGLGNGDIFVFMSAAANATATCGNPGTNTFQAPGRNPAPVTVSGGEFIPASSVDKNGNVPFDVTTAAPANNPRPATKQECPSTSWTYTITELAFTSATIKIYQPATGDPANPGPLVLTVTCTFSSPTGPGKVSDISVSCTQA